MSRNVALLLVLIFLTASFIVAPLPVKAASQVIVVPDDYPTISAAVLAAADGDSVFVKKGTYEEDALEINKPLTLIGENASATVIHNPWQSPPWDPSSSPLPPQGPPAIQVTANNVKISGFTINGDVLPISVLADKALIVGNIIASIEVHGNNNTISKNSIKTYVKCTGSYNNFISNPLIGGGSDGFFIGGSFNVIYDNNLSGCSITLTAEANTIAKNSGYISLGFNSGSSHSIVYGNRISGELGLLGFNHIFYANEISRISIGGGGSPYASDNTFYHNNILGTVPELLVNTPEPGLLVWINGEEGNYWKSYRGADADGDGIGDVPYNVTARYYYNDGTVRKSSIVDCGQDSFPLMAPFDVDSVAVELPEWVPLDFETERSIAVLSPQNMTYTAADVPLDFTAPESAG